MKKGVIIQANLAEHDQLAGIVKQVADKFGKLDILLPYLKETKGKIINFASGAGINGDVNQISYAAAKEI